MLYIDNIKCEIDIRQDSNHYVLEMCNYSIKCLLWLYRKASKNLNA